MVGLAKWKAPYVTAFSQISIFLLPHLGTFSPRNLRSTTSYVCASVRRHERRLPSCTFKNEPIPCPVPCKKSSPTSHNAMRARASSLCPTKNTRCYKSSISLSNKLIKMRNNFLYMLFHALPEITLHVSQTCLCHAWNEVIDTRHFWEKESNSKIWRTGRNKCFPLRCCCRGLHYST